MESCLQYKSEADYSCWLCCYYCYYDYFVADWAVIIIFRACDVGPRICGRNKGQQAASSTSQKCCNGLARAEDYDLDGSHKAAKRRESSTPYHVRASMSRLSFKNVSCSHNKETKNKNWAAFPLGVFLFAVSCGRLMPTQCYAPSCRAL